MGSPVSAVVANLYTEHFEQFALESAPAWPRLWKRYVDDTCCIVNSGSVEELHHPINSIHPSIQLTAELEVREDDSLNIIVYRKPKHTDRYLDFKFHH